MIESSRQFLRARDLLLASAGNLERATREFRWPVLSGFNWARHYFDVIAKGNRNTALRVVSEGGDDESIDYDSLSMRSSQAGNFLLDMGLKRGDRILVMLPNVVALWEILLGAMKVGVAVIPTSTLVESQDLIDRVLRGDARGIVTTPDLTRRFNDIRGISVRISVGEDIEEGWVSYNRSFTASSDLGTRPETGDEDIALLYFTSGTTSKPKLVAHTMARYPAGHLSTMYWLGVKPGDVHLNLSMPGWAKHAWSSFFAPFNAEACVLSLRYERFSAGALLEQMTRCGVTTFCAPPTVWRMIIREDLAARAVKLREACSAGEPLNPEVISGVLRAWKLWVRDGFGQTETTAQIGNTPGSIVKPGSMGRLLPGCRAVLRDSDGLPTDDGEICIDLWEESFGTLSGYVEGGVLTPRGGDFYRTGDLASRDNDGYFTYIGRKDDVFKSSDYRISPFELESVVIEHEAVEEAAVVPSPDALKLAVPKAFIKLASEWAASRETAASIFQHCRARLSPYKRIRRIQFIVLPKTISGKIRRADLRELELGRGPQGTRDTFEFWEEDCSDTEK